MKCYKKADVARIGKFMKAASLRDQIVTVSIQIDRDSTLVAEGKKRGMTNPSLTRRIENNKMVRRKLDHEYQALTGQSLCANFDTFKTARRSGAFKVPVTTVQSADDFYIGGIDDETLELLDVDDTEVAIAENLGDDFDDSNDPNNNFNK